MRRPSERLDDALVWLTATQRNLRSFAVLRIIYGIAVLVVLVPSAPDRSLLWGEASFWVDPEAKRRGFWTFDLFLPKDSPAAFDLAFFGLIVLAVLFTVGYRTRLVLPAMLVLLLSLQANNPYVLNGGDTLMRLTMLFMLFANLSEHFSLDAVRRRRRRSRRIVPAHVANAAHNVALVLCCFQIIVVYAVSGVWKLKGSEWLDGTALFYALRLEAFQVQPLVSELLWQSSLMITVATVVALWTQTLFPLALLWRPTRVLALVSLMFMHVGIAALLGLWPFSLAMIALDMLFIRDSTWLELRDRLEPFRRRLTSRVRPKASRDRWHRCEDGPMKRAAALFDLDGTLCDTSSITHLVAGSDADHRAFHAASADCPPADDVLAAVADARRRGLAVVLWTGREFVWRDLTLDWLAGHEIAFDGLYMRLAADYRPATKVKAELLRDIVGDGFSVTEAWEDDRPVAELLRGEGIEVTVVPGMA